MTTPPRQMALTLFMLAAGYHKDSWRRPGSRSETLGGLELISDMALAAEAAKIHAVFFGDVVTAQTILEGNIKNTGLYEPVTALSALAARTSQIGLVGTLSTTFTEPYNVARQLNGLDTLSGGRAGWNIVTSWMGNENFGINEMPDPTERYRRAHEFVEVTMQLWDSWSDDAVLNDRQSGVWADPLRIHRIDHKGDYYSVQGPLNMRRSPQGHPVLCQAGSSPAGLELGSSIADMIYTAQPIKQKAVAFYKQFKDLVASKGRNPDQVKVIPGILPIVGETRAEAEEMAHELAGYVSMEHGRVQIATALKTNLDDIDLDDIIPAERFSDDPGRGSRYQIYKRLGRDQRLTLRELILEDARAGGHQWLVGTASEIADTMIDWFDSQACDGFSLNPPYIFEGVERIFTLLVPELQDRGYFQEEYTGTTLRENLGLDRPSA